MQEENSNLVDQPSRGYYKFTYAKNVRTWQELLNTLKPVSFDESFNLFSNQQIEHFWRLQLEQLSKQTQKICILVPVQVKTKINKKAQSTIRQPNESVSHNPKEKNKGKKNYGQNKVILNKKILQIAMKMIQKDFPKLSYDYASLFIGNQKQLLIYRYCFAIQSYIERYRLPNTFKQPFAHLQGLTDQYFYLKIQRNKAISTFDQPKIQKSNKKIDNILLKIKKSINQFRDQWKMILYDFRAKSKCKDLILNHISTELIDQLKPLCLQCQTDIINRFSQCDFDQYKDIVVVKKEDPRLQKIEYGPQQQPTTIKYEYISAKKQPEPPLDIKNHYFIGIDIKKQCYRYNFQFQHSSEQNMLQGLFIRSQYGDHSYQLNIDVKPNCKDVRVDIYPYRLGKSVYEIYTWNRTGFTKSTDKIVLYNQMPFSKQGQPIKNYHVYFLGQSERGLRYCEDNNQNEIILFQYSKICQTAKNIDICNSAIICDALGEVAIWGEFYNPYADQQAVLQQISPKHFKIEPPSIVLSQKYIRKVSCGDSHSLMLSTFGQVYSMGINQYGQLGLGHIDRREENYHPNQICKFTNDNSPFIVDIHASVSGASFAVNSKGELYRWGKNQVEQTVMAIEDRFGSIINYSATPLLYRCCNPTKMSKQLLREPVKQIISGNNFYFALTYSGVLYGWGQCKNLGINWLQDKEERVVLDIVNPIELMKDIQSIVAGFQHVIAITKQGKIIGWGDVTAFSKNSQAKFTKTPIDVTQQYGGKKQVKLIRAGRCYTVLLTHTNQLRIIGKCEHFQKSNYKFDVAIVDFACNDEEFIAILCQGVF